MLPFRKVLLIYIIAMLLVLLVGCPAQRPDLQPTPLDEEYNDEPMLSVYDIDTEEVMEMPLEEYLMGVVAAEMEPTWPQEALAAQAIIARTFTLKKIEEGGVEARGTDASTDIEEFQAYDADRINEALRQAVANTRGKVASYQGRLINGWFHADGGGKTAASAEEGLAFTEEETPYIKSVDDPGFAITLEENKSWTAIFPLEEVRQAMRETTGNDPGAIQSVEVTEEGPSGRAMQVRVGDVTVSGPALRLALGSTVMRSTLWDEIRVEDGQLIISGKGYGHGVGLSQWGAKALAQDGQSAEDIVHYFYEGIQIEKLWD